MHRFLLLFLTCWCFGNLLSVVAMADRSAQTVVDEGYVFTKVKATGTLFNKDRFLHYYRLTPGEPFDKKKHEHSLEKMRTELRNEGYLAAKIADTVSYNKKSKTVQVALSVSLGNLFIIDKVTVALEGGGNESQELKLGLEKLLERALVRHALDKEVLDRQAQEIKAWLRKKGYSSPQLSLVTKNDGAHKASLSFSVVLPAKKELVFVGNSFFTTENLLDEIFAADGDELLPAVLLAEDIEALYKSKGFF